MGDGPPPDGFDYGERREDGQYENHPTTDEGEFVQPVRGSYVHVEECGGTTRMGTALAESFARDPEQYGKTFCATCSDYYPLDEFEWKGTEIRLDEVGVVADHEDDPNADDEEDDLPDDPVHYVHSKGGTVTEEEFVERFGETELSLLTPDPLKYSAGEGLVSLSFEEIRLRISGTDKTGVAYLGVYDCGYSNPMKEDYALTGGSEIILTLDGGEFEVVGDDEED